MKNEKIKVLVAKPINTTKIIVKKGICYSEEFLTEDYLKKIYHHFHEGRYLEVTDISEAPNKNYLLFTLRVRN